MPTLSVPLEIDEEVMFCEWLDLKGYKHSSIPNATFTRSWKQKMRNKKMGLHAGLPDRLVIVKKWLVFIEMKRIKGGVLSDEQQSWIAAINETENGKAFVCKGALDAIKTIESIV